MRVGDYELVGELARGGMGVVYRARSPGLSREVALKLLHAEGLLNEAQQARFLREGELTARLEHPGIVRVHAAGVEQGRPYLVYELVEGASTLANVLDEAPLPTRLEWIEQAARALGHAHLQGITHRDVKPENLLVDRAGAIKVADFGLAHAPGLQRLTRSGAALGTPQFMAPEQVVAERAQQGPPTDVWALGVILYRALTGALPFSGLTLLELAAQITGGLAEGPRARDPSVSRELDAVCRAALRSQPAERYPDAEAFADDLARARAGQAPKALRRPRRWALPLVSLLVVLGLALGAALLAADGRAPAAASTPPSTPGQATVSPSPSPSPSRANPLPGGRLLRIPASREPPASGALFVDRRRLLVWGGTSARLLALSERADTFEREREWSSYGPIGALIPDPRGGYLLGTGPLVAHLQLDRDELLPVSKPRDGAISGLAASPDGKLLATARGRRLQVLGRRKDKLLHAWPAHASPIRQVTFVDDETLLWIRTGDVLRPDSNLLETWRRSQPDAAPTAGGLLGSARAFVPLRGGAQLVIASGLLLNICGPPPELPLISPLRGDTASVGLAALGGEAGDAAAPVRALWVSADERRLLGLASRGTPPRSELLCWDPHTRQPIGAGLELPDEYLLWFAVSPDEALVVFGGLRGVLVWSLAPILKR